MPKLQDLRTKRVDAVEKARLAEQRMKADGREDPEKWTVQEAEEITNLVKAADTAEDEYKAFFNLTKVSDRLKAHEDGLNDPEPGPSNRRNLGMGNPKGGDGASNVIRWSAATKRLMRNYVRQGNELSTEEYDDAFSAYVRGNDRKMMDLQRAQNAAAGMSSDLEEKGGYFITPETWATEMIKLVDNEVYVQGMSRVIMLPNGTRTLAARVRRQKVSSFTWGGENTDTSGTVDQSLLYGKRSLTPNYLMGSCVISRDLLRNVPSAEGMVMEEMAINAGEVLEPAFLTGDGNMKPLGLLTATTDGISTGRDITTVGAGSFTADDFINQKYGLKLKYRNKAQWMLHRYVLNSLALLKTGDGQYLWRQGIQIGEPDRLLGLPITETEWMPYVNTSGFYFSLLGDFSWYWIVYELSMEMQRLIELRARTNENEYLFRMKLDAAPMLEEAFIRGKRQ